MHLKFTIFVGLISIFSFQIAEIQVETQCNPNRGCIIDWIEMLLDDLGNINKKTSKAFAIKSFLDFLVHHRSTVSISSVKVPKEGCSEQFVTGVLNLLNKKRLLLCYDPLKLSNTATEAAQKWVSTNRDPKKLYNEREQRYGQLVWKDIYPGKITDKNIEYPFWAPFEQAKTNPVTKEKYQKWDDFSRPTYFSEPNDKQEFRHSEWKLTTEMGVGCSHYFLNDATHVYLTVYFRLPNTK